MECPTCHSQMTAGEISLETTLADLATGGGAGLSEVRFRESDHEPVTILTHSASNPGLTCKSCGHFLIISNFEYTDTECLVCRTAMPAGVTSCPNCGWSYE